MKPQRYCLKQDQDCHWFLIKVEDKARFEKMCEAAYAADDFADFEKAFPINCNGYHTLTFTDPVEEFSK